MILAAVALIALNPAVTPATIHETVCVPGWAADYRRSHPVYLKRRNGFTRDHIVPIELGGSSDPENIQYQTKAEARRKDKLESALHKAVCSGTLSLPEAQARMEAWR